MVNIRDEIRRGIEITRGGIAEAARRSGRAPEEIRLMGVTKFQSLEAIYAARDNGLSLMGENRVQEREEKNSRWEGDPVEWHMIGHLQRNKAKRAVELFDCVESVDSLELASMIEKFSSAEDGGIKKSPSPYPIMIEVNVSGEISKHGVDSENFFALIDNIAVKCPHIEMAGLMTIGPLTDDRKKIGESFALLRELRDEARKRTGMAFPHLSMGMSGDYELAIEEGATIVRVGTAIFGARNYQSA